MEKKKIFFFAALGIAVAGFVIALVAGILGTAEAVHDAEALTRGAAYFLPLVSGVILILTAVLAFVGAGYIFKKALIAPIFLAVAAVLCFISLMSFGPLGLVAGILLLGAAALAFLSRDEQPNANTGS